MLVTSQLPIQTTKIFYTFLTCTCAPPTLKKVLHPCVWLVGCALWCSQIVHIPYSLNTTTAMYFATECSDVTVFVWGHVHATILLLYLTLTRVGLSVLLST